MAFYIFLLSPIHSQICLSFFALLLLLLYFFLLDVMKVISPLDLALHAPVSELDLAQLVRAHDALARLGRLTGATLDLGPGKHNESKEVSVLF